LVAVGLQQSIALAVTGVVLAIATPVVAMLALPSLPSIPLVGPVIGVAGHLVSLPLRFSGSLTKLARAVSLGFDTGIGDKVASAVGASILGGHGFLLCEALHVAKGLVQEE
jgi:hypothetical protein